MVPEVSEAFFEILGTEGGWSPGKVTRNDLPCPCGTYVEHEEFITLYITYNLLTSTLANK